MAGPRILQELEQTVYEVPGQPRKQMVILYQLEGQAPRTVWVYKDMLPDLVWLDEHPGTDVVPEDIQAMGDKVRKDAIDEDQKRLRLKQPRTLA